LFKISFPLRGRRGSLLAALGQCIVALSVRSASVSTMQFFPKSLCRPSHYWMHCRQHQWSLFCECNIQSSRRSSPHSASERYTFCCLLKLKTVCIWQGTIFVLSALLTLPLLVLGLCLDPSLEALVPVVLRDAHCSVLAEKRKAKCSQLGCFEKFI
jgi:hypothetical protein